MFLILPCQNLFIDKWDPLVPTCPSGPEDPLDLLILKLKNPESVKPYSLFQGKKQDKHIGIPGPFLCPQMIGILQAHCLTNAECEFFMAVNILP